MNEDKGIMKIESVLPEDFDGTFRFTNWTEEEFVGVWGSKEYHFPALTTSPMVIPEHSPLEVQHIRKKFAKDLSEREYFKSKSYEKTRSVEGNKDEGIVQPRLNSFHMAGTYTLKDLEPYIQRCLEPLPIARASVQEAPKPIDVESTLSRNEEGNLNTEAIDRKTSLKDKALRAGEK